MFSGNAILYIGRIVDSKMTDLTYTRYLPCTGKLSNIIRIVSLEFYHGMVDANAKLVPRIAGEFGIVLVGYRGG